MDRLHSHRARSAAARPGVLLINPFPPWVPQRQTRGKVSSCPLHDACDMAVRHTRLALARHIPASDTQIDRQCCSELAGMPTPCWASTLIRCVVVGCRHLCASREHYLNAAPHHSHLQSQATCHTPRRAPAAATRPCTRLQLLFQAAGSCRSAGRRVHMILSVGRRCQI